MERADIVTAELKTYQVITDNTIVHSETDIKQRNEEEVYKRLVALQAEFSITKQINKQQEERIKQLTIDLMQAQNAERLAANIAKEVILHVKELYKQVADTKIVKVTKEVQTLQQQVSIKVENLRSVLDQEEQALVEAEAAKTRAVAAKDAQALEIKQQTTLLQNFIDSTTNDVQQLTKMLNTNIAVTEKLKNHYHPHMASGHRAFDATTNKALNPNNKQSIVWK